MHPEQSHNQEVYTGRLLEDELLGHPDTSKIGPKNKHLPFWQAIELVEDSQIGDPSDPEPRFSSDLHASVAERMHLEDYSQLELFTAVDTPLDRFYGVDAFFIFHRGDKDRIFTIDVTSNPDKPKHQTSTDWRPSYKADMVIPVFEEVLDFEGHKPEYDRLIAYTSDQIAKALLS
jgi:hypothetical protein